MSTVQVEYLGSKKIKHDNVGKTGVEWFGKGDVQEYPADKVAMLKKHPDVWAVKEVKAGKAATGLESAPSSGPESLITIDDIVKVVDKFDPANLEQCTKAGIPRAKAVEEILGQKVSKEELDEAWDAVLEARMGAITGDGLGEDVTETGEE